MRPMPLDSLQLSRTLVRLLREEHLASGLSVQPDGWFSLEEVIRVISLSLQVDLVVADLEQTRLSGGLRWEIASGRIRVIPEPPREVWPGRRDPMGPGWRDPLPPGWRDPARRLPEGPDILYHVLPRERIAELRHSGAIGGRGNGVSLTWQEDLAWRIGHRRWNSPVVLYVDAARARRDGIRFQRTRSGQYQASMLPVRHVLNLRDGFGEQASAGGFLIDWSRGDPWLALVRVQRRSGVTWEVAKGKIESGEQPESAAIREVQEEMGLKVPAVVTGRLGMIRYGFSTPDGQPRLKTIYLYLLETAEPVQTFDPSRQEGIDCVRWFPLDEAILLLTHPSLRGITGRLLTVLGERALQLGRPQPRDLPDPDPCPDPGSDPCSDPG